AGVLTIEPSRPFTPGPEADPRRLLIRLRSTGPAWANSADGPAATVSLPALQPRGDSGRAGTLTLRLGSAVALAAGPPAPAPRPDVTQPFRGAPEATLRLRGRRGRFQGQSDADVALSSDTMRVTYQLRLTPTAGAGQEVLLI